MITIDSLDSNEELEVFNLAKEAGKNVGQMAADIIREYLEDRHDTMLADKALEEIQSGESRAISWRELKAELYDDVDN
jgi:predicted DNA-binding protein